MYPKNFLVNNDEVLKAYLKILKEDGNENFDSYVHTIRHTLRGINFENKRVVDVGSGKGLMTIYAALSGAKQVLSLEPELEGSRSKVFHTQKDRINKLGLKNVEILRQDFNTWSYSGKPFDIVLSFASINHIYESPYHAMRDSETYEKYAKISSKMKKILKETTGVAVITDACRYGLFFWLKKIGINRPWRMNKRTSIDFKYHQNPSVWEKIFLDAGFSKVNIIYPLPFKLRRYSGIVDNPIGNFLLEAKFVLHCFS